MPCKCEEKGALLPRNVPTRLQGIRRANQIDKTTVRRAQEAARSQMPHTVLGGATRNNAICFGGPCSKVPGEKSAVPLLLLGALAWVVLK